MHPAEYIDGSVAAALAATLAGDMYLAQSVMIALARLRDSGSSTMVCKAAR